MAIDKNISRKRRHHRVRKTLSGTQDRPRLVVFRSLNDIYAQIIDDESGKTLVAESSLKIKKGAKIEKAKEVGEKIAKIAVEKGIKKVCFDRNAYRYHGRVKALAEAARSGGLNF